MGAAETFIIYFKVTLMCGFILASPVIFYQFWAFVGAGLYPHEKRYVHVYLPFSVGLFIAGVVLCFAWVLPGALNYFLTFNEWFDVDPDFRLKNGSASPPCCRSVFGISFQTPLVMLFLSRLGMFGWDDYLRKWRRCGDGAGPVRGRHHAHAGRRDHDVLIRPHVRLVHARHPAVLFGRATA